MTRMKRQKFIDDELKGLWPQWSPTKAEMRAWMRALDRFEYGIARDALEQVFCTPAGNYQRPRLASFLAKVRLLATQASESRQRPVPEAHTHVFLECLTPPPSHPNWTGLRKGVYVQPASKQGDLDYVRTCAEVMRRRFEQIYGGHWITVIEKPQPPQPDPGPSTAPKPTPPS